MNLKNTYIILEKLGEGSYGKVYKAQNIKTNSFVAIKKIKIDDYENGIPSTTIREISNLRILDHPNIIQILDLFFENNQIYLVFEYMQYDLRKFISKNKISEKNIIKIFFQIIDAINYLHSNLIFHRDLKPENILIDENFNIKIADFGLSKTFSEYNESKKFSEHINTLWYKPPEILLGNKIYDSSIDIFSTGLIITELLMGEQLIKGDSKIGQIFKMFNIFGTPTINSWPELIKYPYYKINFPKWKENKFFEIISKYSNNKLLIDILNKMLILNPKNRMGSESILKNEIFYNFKY